MAGMKLDSDTLALFKLADPQPVGNIYNTTGYEVRDLSPNNYDLGPRSNAVLTNLPTLTWGLKGPLVRNKFSWYFSGVASYCKLQSAVIDAAFTAAQCVAHTWEWLVKTAVAGYQGVFCVSGETGPGVPADWLVQFNILANGSVMIFWENNDLNQTTTTPVGVYPADNDWHVVTLMRKPYPADPTKYIVRVYVDGVLAVHQDPLTGFTVGTGLIPQAGSCSAGSINVGTNGQSSAQNDFNGWACNIRCLKRELSDAEIYADALDLLDDGEIAYAGDVDTLCHWNFNDPPGYIDETDLGFHSSGFGTQLQFYPGTEVRKKLDIYNLHTASRMGNGDTVRVFQYTQQLAFIAKHGRKFYQFFNSDFGLPEWTVEGFVTFPAQGLPATMNLVNFAGVLSEAEADNYLAQAKFSTAWVPSLFHERGAGTDVSATAPGAFPDTALGEHYCRAHLAVRCRIAPSDPTKVIHEWFYNGTLRQTVGPVLPPTGGANAALYVFDDWYGTVQEIKISKGAVSDAKLLVNANAFGVFGPIITNITPTVGTALAPMTPVEFDVYDVSPGVEIAMVWLKYKYYPERWVVYDSDEFCVPFRQLSTATWSSNLKTLHFKLLPWGGWEGEIEELRVRGIGQYGGIDLEVV